MSIALLSNVTITSLAARVHRVAREEVFCPPGYNTWLQEIANPESALYRSEPQAVFLLLHGDTLLGENPPDTAQGATAILQPMLEAISSAVSARRDIAFVVSTLDIAQKRIRPLVSTSPEMQAAVFWRESLERLSVPILEIAELVRDMGRRHFYNDRVWYMGAIPSSMAGEEALAAEIGQIWNAIRGRRKKCLALDLDNTLWGGVIGELGTEGIHLDFTGSGARFRDFQQRILELKNAGVLLAAISKNNLEDALAGIDHHPAMLLRSNDFVAIRANWEPKPKNLQAIAHELNIGVDSFVFVDDNPIERETMQIALPEVAVPDFPSDSSCLERFMREVAREYFLQVRLTREDTVKTEQYRADASRKAQQSTFANIGDYLASLEMQMSIQELNESNLARAAQLTQKTNQFNLATRRYAETDLQKLLQAPDTLVLIADLSDRFGAYGKIALCIVHIEQETAAVDTYLMSCRVMERGVETAFLNEIEQRLVSRGVKEITASYVPSGKNAVVSDFWHRMGYDETTSLPDGEKRYRAALPRERSENTFIWTKDRDERNG